MQGQIVKIISDMHVVSIDKVKYNCKCRGIFRHNRIVPLVGDYVEFDKEKLVINKILPRNNEFKRPSVANIDQAFLITSLKQPDFSFDLLDKLIAVMELHNTEAIICVTKKDLLKCDEFAVLGKHLDYYKSIGYKVVYNTELDEIKELLKNKTSVFTGQTGAGKSTLLNQLNPNWNLATAEISMALGRGKHTTRVVELFDILDGKVLDTPGFSALEFNDYKKEEIRDAFIEFSFYPCQFKDCMHTNEGECQIKQEITAGNIIPSRYKTYLKLIDEKVKKC